MGHRQKMTDKQRLAWDVMQYKARLSARRGHNYTYYNDQKHNDWNEFVTTTSESYAIEQMQLIKSTYKKVRIFVGFEKTVQRVKHFTVMYKN